MKVKVEYELDRLLTFSYTKNLVWFPNSSACTRLYELRNQTTKNLHLKRYSKLKHVSKEQL